MKFKHHLEQLFIACDVLRTEDELMKKDMHKEWEEKFDKKFVKKQNIFDATPENPLIIGQEPPVNEVKSFIKNLIQEQDKEHKLQIKELIESVPTRVVVKSKCTCVGSDYCEACLQEAIDEDWNHHIKLWKQQQIKKLL